MHKKIDIFSPVTDLARGGALESWVWLVGDSASVRLLTAMGDVFFVRKEGLLKRERVYFLDTGTGEVECASMSWKKFRAMIAGKQNFPGHWFKYSLLQCLSDHPLAQGECYSPKVLPVLGGEYCKDNYQSISWVVHLDMAGQLHRQIKDLPTGTPVNSISLQISENQTFTHDSSKNQA